MQIQLLSSFEGNLGVIKWVWQIKIFDISFQRVIDKRTGMNLLNIYFFNVCTGGWRILDMFPVHIHIHCK